MSLQIKLLLLVASLPEICCAQSVLKNPNFDQDISGWTSSGGVDWASFENSSDSPHDFGGSLAFMTYDEASAEQCISVPPEKGLFDYNYSYEELDYDMKIVDQDPLCDRYSQGVVVAFEAWQGPSCSALDSKILARFSSSYIGLEATDGWIPGQAAVDLLPGTDHLRVYLSAACASTKEGVTTVFFDNFRMRSERIFSDGFSPYDG